MAALAGSLGAGPGCGGARQQASISIPTASSDPAAGARALERRLETEGPSATLYSRLAAARLAAGQPAAAVTLVARALALDPRHTGALVVAARASSARGDHAAAARHYEAASDAIRPSTALPPELANEWAAALLSLAAERLAAGRPGDADAALRAMVVRLPGPSSALARRRGRLALDIVELFLRQGRGGPAEAALELARSAGVNPAELRFAEARAGHLLGRVDKAAGLFKVWAEDDDTSSRWVRVAEHYQGADDAEAALEAYRAATREPSATRESLTAHGRLAILLDEPDEADVMVRRAAALAADDASRAATLVEGAEAMRNAGKRSHALALFEDAAAAAPATEAVVKAYAEYLGHLGKRDELNRLLAGYRAAVGDGAEVVRASAEQLVRAGAIDHAVNVLERAASAPDADPQLWLDLARVRDRRVRLRSGRDAAVDAFERAVGDDPRRLVLAGRLWLDFRKLQRARRVIERVLALEPGNVEAGLLQADLLHAKGNRGAESRSLEALVDKADNPALAAARVGERWQLRRRPREALPWLRRALDLAPEDASALRRRIHAALYEGYLTSRPADESTAAVHMRAWLAEGGPETRAADLETLLARTVGIGSLVGLRVEVLEELVALQPDRPELLEVLGRQLLRLKQHRRAEAVFGRLVDRSTDPANDASRVGRLFFDEGLLDAALVFYDRVEPGRIDQPRVLRVLGEHLARRGADERADAMFRLFLARADDARYRSELTIFMRTATRLRRWPLARQAARAVLALSEGNREAALVLGESALALGEEEQAREWLARSMAAGATPRQRSKASLAVAAVMERQGRLEMATGAYEFAMDEGSFSEALNAFEKLAELQRRRRDGAGLMRAVELLVGKSPKAQDTQRAIKSAVDALQLAGQEDEASALIDKALERRPNERALLDLAVQSAVSHDDVVRAVALVQRFVRAKGGAPEEWEKAATTLSDAGHPEAGLALLESQAQRNAAPALHLAYGQHLLAAGRYDDAEKTFMHALSQSLSARDIVAGVDAAYREVGQYSRLREFHARAAALSPTRSEHTLALGKVALEQGDVSTARQAFTRHLALNERGQLDVAKAWASAGWVDDALEHYTRAWEQASPGQHELPLDKVVDLLTRHGRAADVEALALKHLRRSRDQVKALEQVIAAFERAGDLTGAVRWSRRADEIAPSPERALDRARMMLVAADFAGATSELLAYVRKKAEASADARRLVRQPRRGGLSEATARSAALLVGVLQPARALDLCREVIGAYGRDPVLSALEAWLLVESGDPEAALVLLSAPGTKIGAVNLETVKRLVKALVERDRLDEAADLLGEHQVATWSPDLAVRRLELLVRRGRWGLADQQAGELLVIGDAELATRAAWAAFDNGYYDLASRIVTHITTDASGYRHRTIVMELSAALQAIRSRSPRRDGDMETAVVGWPADDLLGAAQAEARMRFDAGDPQGAYDAAMQGLEGAPADAELLRVAVDSAALLPDGGAEVAAALERFSSRQRPRARTMGVAASWLEAAGRPDLALEIVEQLIAFEPGTLARRVQAVELAMGAGQLDRAVTHQDAALVLAQGEAQSILLLARVWADWLERDRAVELLARIDDARGDIGMERDLLAARLALHQQDGPGIAAALARAVREAPDPSVARLRGARLLLEDAKAPQEALALLDPLIAEGGAGPRHLSLAARAAWRAGSDEEARRHLAALDRAQPGARLRPDLLRAAVAAGDLKSVRSLAGALLVAGAPKPRMAVAALVTSAIDAETESWSVEERGPLLELAEEYVTEAAAVMSPGTMTSWLAMIEELRGDVEGALGAYEHALIRDPTTPGHANNLAYAMSRHGVALDRALELVQDAVVRTGRPVASYLDTEAWVLHRLGRSAEALPIMRRVLGLTGDRRLTAPETMVELLFHLASIQEAVGESAAARTTWRDCARRAPTTRYGARCMARWRELDPRPTRP